MAKLDRVLVCSRHTVHLCFSYQPTDRVLSEALIVHPLAGFDVFAVLGSRIFGAWAWLLGSTIKSDLRYSPSDCFEPFPFPEPDPRSAIPELEAIGKRLDAARSKFMRETQQGLTKTYNALKDPQQDDPALLELRELHLDLDRAVLAAYHWSDIPVPPYTADAREIEAFEDEVIDRLFALNGARAAAEAAGKPAKRGKQLGLGVE